jgi:hypothetical protein
MKDIILTVVRDEEDVIATFIRFYLAQGFDEVHIVDNGSIDGTRDQIHQLQQAGWPVALQEDARSGYERFLTDHFHRVGQLVRPRWLFFLDCDEFVLFPGGAKEYLNWLPAEVNCLRLRQREMFPLPEEASGSPPWAFLQADRTEPQFNDTTKDVTRYTADARVFAGKHRIEQQGQQVYAPDDLYIRHYKYRSMSQARRKERNRLADQEGYQRADLEKMSCFGAEKTLAWFALCRENAGREAWRESFSTSTPSIEDRGLIAALPRLLESEAFAEMGAEVARG